MSWLGEETEALVKDVKATSVASGGALASGIYKSVIEKCFIRKTDSGATMFHLEAKSGAGDDEKSIFWSTCLNQVMLKETKLLILTRMGKRDYFQVLKLSSIYSLQ